MVPRPPNNRIAAQAEFNNDFTGRQVAETGGRIKGEETQDDTDPDRIIYSTETEIAGLADS